MSETKKEAAKKEVPAKAARSRVGLVAFLVGLVAAIIGAGMMTKAQQDHSELLARETAAKEKMAEAETLAAAASSRAAEAEAAVEAMELSRERRQLAEAMFPLPNNPFGATVGSEAAVNVQLPPPPPRMEEILSTSELAAAEAEADRFTPEGFPKMRSREAAKLLEMAKLQESEQNIVAALKHLDDASQLEPDHPAILYQMGIIFDKVGQKEKAVNYFQTVAAMEDRAGELVNLALHYLNGNEPTALAGSDLTDRPLSVGPAFYDVSTEEATGQRTVKLSLSIRAAAGQEIDPYEVRPEIYFYDLVSGQHVEMCDGSQPPAEEVNPWRSETPDYKDPNEELLDVVFRIPKIDDGEERQFFGYVVKLYYRDEIQDVLVEPRVMVELLSNRGGDESELDATLFGN